MQAFQNYLFICFWLMLGFINLPKNNHTVFTQQKRVSAAQLIVPGKSVGQTKLNENAKQVFKRLGKPDGGDAAMGKSLSVWYAGHNPARHQTQIFFTRKVGINQNESLVNQIRVTSPYFKTANGIGAGSTLKQINASFTTKKTSTYQENKQTFFVYDTPKGIAFEVSAEGKCVGVIVYLLGDLRHVTYLPFHHNQKMLAAAPRL